MLRTRLLALAIASMALFAPLASVSAGQQEYLAAPGLQSGCPAAQVWEEGRELTPAEKSTAFSEVLASGQQMYGDYNFSVATTNTPPGDFPPVLAKSVAGIESD